MENETTEPTQSDALPVSQSPLPTKTFGSNKIFYGVILIAFLISVSTTAYLLFGGAKNHIASYLS